MDKIKCTCIEAYTERKLTDPNCCACSCDYNDLVDELNNLRDQNQAMKDILRDAIGLMRSTVVTSGWHQVANVAESLVNSELTTEKE